MSFTRSFLRVLLFAEWFLPELRVNRQFKHELDQAAEVMREDLGSVRSLQREATDGVFTDAAEI